VHGVEDSSRRFRNCGWFDERHEDCRHRRQRFIGRYVLAELARQPVDVVAVTRDAARLAGPGMPGRIVEMDVATPGADCFDRLGRPDVLIHLAWDGLPNYKSLHHFETELPRQFRFLKAMVEAGLPSLLVTGTCLNMACSPARCRKTC